MVHIPDARLIRSTYANRSLSHANRISGRAFAADRETDFGRSETKGPNPLSDGLRFPQRPRAGHDTRPKPRKIEGVPRRRGIRAPEVKKSVRRAR